MSTAIRSKVMSNLSLKMWNFKAHFRGGNRLKKMMVTKDLSSRRKLRKVFKKKFIEKKGFYDQKYEKNWKSKNGVKTALTPLFKELWAIYVFSQTWNLTIAKNTSVNQGKSKHHEKLNFSPQTIKKICRQKSISAPKISKILKVQKWPQKSSRSS